MVAKTGGMLRQRWRGLSAEVGVNLVLPYVVYSYAQPACGDLKALLFSMLPPLGWSVVEFVRKRRVDILSMFILAGIVLSLLAVVGGGSVKFLQLRETLVTGVFGCAFLISALIRRPLIYELARATESRKSAEHARAFEQLMATNVRARRAMLMITVVWGAGLLAQTALACALVFAVPIKTFLVISPILGYGTMGVLAAWTAWYVQRRRRIAALREAAAVRSEGVPAAS
jgi:hypothetical protein